MNFSGTTVTINFNTDGTIENNTNVFSLGSFIYTEGNSTNVNWTQYFYPIPSFLGPIDYIEA